MDEEATPAEAADPTTERASLPFDPHQVGGEDTTGEELMQLLLYGDDSVDDIAPDDAGIESQPVVTA